ncbi:MAG: hypothetical protein WBW53_19985 [Terriglobales bacterium]
MQKRVKRLFAGRNNCHVRLLCLLVACQVFFIEIPNAGASKRADQQALIVTIPFNGRSGSNETVKRLYKMEDELIKAIEHARAGEYDGDEIGDATFTMYAYGPSADKLFEIARPIFAKYQLPPGSRALKRYGNPGAKEERIDIAGGTAN